MACAAVLVSFANAHAQTEVLRETVVTATRFEQYRDEASTAVQIITQQDMANSGVSSLPDALRILAGINVRGNATGQFDLNSVVDMGGFGMTATQNTMVLVDGRKLNPIDSSDIMWGSVDMSSIERIEIINGGAGVQYGSGATGGLINIITREAYQHSGAAHFSAGSFGSIQSHVQADRRWDDKSFLLHAGVLKSDGWRSNSQSLAKNMMVRGKQVLDAHSYVFAEIGLSEQSNGLTGGVVGKVGEGDQRATKFNNVDSNISSTTHTIRLGGFTALTDLSSLDVDFSVNKKTSDFKQPYFDTADSFGVFMGAGFLTGPGRSDLDGQTIAFNPKWKTLFSNGGHVVVGWDVAKADQSGASYFGTAAQQVILANQGSGFVGNILTDRQSVTLHNSAVYATSQIPLLEFVHAHFGWRTEVQTFDSTDTNKASGRQTSSGQYSANAYEAGLSYKAGLASRYFARINHSFRFANTDEYWGLDPVSYSRVFSGELRPQFTQAYEVGYERSAGRHHGSLMASQSSTQDEIRYNPSYYRNSNLSDEVLRRSLVGSYAYTIPSGSKISMTARLQQATFANGLYKGQALGLVPASIYTASLIQPLDAFSKLGLSVMRVSKQNYDVAPDQMQGKDMMPAFTRADLFWIHQQDKWEYKVTIKNLLNALSSNYGGFAFVQSPGATGSSTYYYFPSDPRSVHFGATYRF